MRLVAVKRQMKWMEVEPEKMEDSNTHAVASFPIRWEYRHLFFEIFRFGDLCLHFFLRSRKNHVYVYVSALSSHRVLVPELWDAFDASNFAIACHVNEDV